MLPSQSRSEVLTGDCGEDGKNPEWLGVAAYVAEVRVSDHVARLDDLREVDVGKGEPTSDEEENPQHRCTLPSVRLREGWYTY